MADTVIILISADESCSGKSDGRSHLIDMFLMEPISLTPFKERILSSLTMRRGLKQSAIRDEPSRFSNLTMAEIDMLEKQWHRKKQELDKNLSKLKELAGI